MLILWEPKGEKKFISQCEVILSILDITWPRAKKHTEIHSSGNDQFSSVTQSCPTLCDHMDHSTPGLPVHYQLPEFTQSCPLSRWCHPTISFSVIPFSSCPQSFPASGSFQMSQLFTSGGQNIGVSASSSVLPVNTQDWSPLGWTSWISLQSKGLSRVFFNTTVQKHQFFCTQLFLESNITYIYDYWKNHSLG